MNTARAKAAAWILAFAAGPIIAAQYSMLYASIFAVVGIVGCLCFWGES